MRPFFLEVTGATLTDWRGILTLLLTRMVGCFCNFIDSEQGMEISLCLSSTAQECLCVGSCLIKHCIACDRHATKHLLNEQLSFTEDWWPNLWPLPTGKTCKLFIPWWINEGSIFTYVYQVYEDKKVGHLEIKMLNVLAFRYFGIRPSGKLMN